MSEHEWDHRRKGNEYEFYAELDTILSLIVGSKTTELQTEWNPNDCDLHKGLQKRAITMHSNCM